MGAAGAGREPPRGSRRSLTEREGAAARPNLRSSTSWGRSLSGQRPGTSRRNRREHRAPPDPASARPRLAPHASPQPPPARCTPGHVVPSHHTACKKMVSPPFARSTLGDVVLPGLAAPFPPQRGDASAAGGRFRRRERVCEVGGAARRRRRPLPWCARCRHVLLQARRCAGSGQARRAGPECWGGKAAAEGGRWEGKAWAAAGVLGFLRLGRLLPRRVDFWCFFFFFFLSRLIT